MARLETSSYSRNSVHIIGRLGKDPDLKYTQSGVAVANLSIATSSKVKGTEKTEWHKVVVWDKAAQFAGEYCAKGDLVGVEGRLETRMWEKDGRKNYTTEIVAYKIDKINWAADTPSDPGPAPGDDFSSDIPF